MCDNRVHETIRNKSTTCPAASTGSELVAPRPKSRAGSSTSRHDGRSVRRWQQQASQPRTKRNPNSRRPGRPSRLSASQIQRLLRALTRGAFIYGYAEDYWTLDRIAHAIWELFQVRYHPSSIWHILQRAGWSCQKPQRRSLARDDQAITHWKRYVWPHIKKVA